MLKFILSFLVFAVSAHAMESIEPETLEYLAKHSSPEADAQWKAKLEARINQMLKDSESLSGPQAAAEKLGFDYFADHRNDFEQKRLSKQQKIDTCRLYQYFVTHGWEFPSKVRDDISKVKFRIWFLDTGER